jgi:hypothetical protein
MIRRVAPRLGSGATPIRPALDPEETTVSQIIQIQQSPFIDTELMLTALAAQGLSGALIDDARDLRLLVSGEMRTMPRRVLSALESVTRGLIPLVPEQLDEHTFAVRPPAG